MTEKELIGKFKVKINKLDDKASEIMLRERSGVEISKERIPVEAMIDAYDDAISTIKSFLKDYKLVKKGDISDMMARSGWEMLPAKIIGNESNRRFYNLGAKEMEAVWKEIISKALGGGE